MDIIFLKEMTVESHIGVHAWEQLLPQKIMLDIEMAMPSSLSCKSDEIKDTVNYAEVVEFVEETLQKQSFQLIEALGEKLANGIMERFHVAWIRITVTKPAIIPKVKSIGVTLERGTYPK
jgi:7,8-dihydroneopterin aldolase/epimerase/oxygenase